jgi:peroxiredoxin
MHDNRSSPPAVEDGGADHLRSGMKLPHITLPTTSGSNVSPADLSGWAVRFVYPWTGRPGQPNPPNWDDIPGAHGSTPEIERFRDLAPGFHELGVALVGLSRQETAYQCEMAARLRVPFPILSDAEGHFAQTLQLPTFATGGEVYVKRLTLVLKAGTIEHAFYPVPKPEAHADEVLSWLRLRLG